VLEIILTNLILVQIKQDYKYYYSTQYTASCETDTTHILVT